MKARFYLLTVFIFLALAVSAQVQKFNTMLSEEWTNNAWANSSKITNTYDANGHLINTLIEDWNAEVSAWNNGFMFSHTPNTDGTVKETLSQAWENNAWLDVQKTVYTYSPTKKVLTEMTQLLFEGTAMDFMKNTYTYNEIDSLATMVTQMVNPLTLELVNSLQETYTYNTDGTEHQMVSQTWSLLNVWENANRYTNTYDNAKKITSDLTEKWENNAWVNESRTTYTYNAGGFIQESLEQEWVADQWTDTTKDLFTYTAKNEVYQVVSQGWKADQSLWENQVRITFSYVPTGLEPEKLSDKAFMAYPNPFVDLITIQSGSLGEHGIEIINSSGQVISSFKTNEKRLNLDLGSLNKGIYFIKLKSPENTQSIKVLKVR